MTRLYWIGPYETLVPINVESVVAYDGGNHFGRDGSVTEMGILDDDGDIVGDIGKEAYLAKYATCGEYGLYYYTIGEQAVDPFHYDHKKMCDVDAYWIGPHGMLVPSDVPYVIAENGRDLHNADGSITTLRPSREHYLDTYASNDWGSRLWYYCEQSRYYSSSEDDTEETSQSSSQENKKKRKHDDATQ